MPSRNMHLIVRSAHWICVPDQLSSASQKANCLGSPRLPLRLPLPMQNLRDLSRRPSTGTPGCGRPSPFPHLPHCWRLFRIRISPQSHHCARQEANRASCRLWLFMPGQGGAPILRWRRIEGTEPSFRLSFRRIPAMHRTPSSYTILRASNFGHEA